jgi:hypothetical protein
MEKKRERRRGAFAAHLVPYELRAPSKEGRIELGACILCPCIFSSIPQKAATIPFFFLKEYETLRRFGPQLGADGRPIPSLSLRWRFPPLPHHPVASRSHSPAVALPARSFPETATRPTHATHDRSRAGRAPRRNA